MTCSPHASCSKPGLAWRWRPRCGACRGSGRQRAWPGCRRSSWRSGREASTALAGWCPPTQHLGGVGRTPTCPVVPLSKADRGETPGYCPGAWRGSRAGGLLVRLAKPGVRGGQDDRDHGSAAAGAGRRRSARVGRIPALDRRMTFGSRDRWLPARHVPGRSSGCPPDVGRHRPGQARLVRSRATRHITGGPR